MNVYKVWKPLEGIPAPLYLERLMDDAEGFRLLLRDGSEDGRILRIAFGNVLSYRNAPERFLLKVWEENESFEGHSSLLTVEDSSYLAWLHEQSYEIHSDEPIVHYAIYTPDDCVDVLAPEPPQVEWLFPKS